MVASTLSLWREQFLAASQLALKGKTGKADIRDRPGGLGQFDLWMAARETQDAPWGEPVNLGPTIDRPGNERDPSVSADGSTLYFGSDRPGGHGCWDIWHVSIELIVDLNGDGIVDSADTCVM